MAESGLQSRIRAALVKSGAYVVTSRVATVAGTPDLIVCWQGHFIGLEIKTRGGKTDKGRARRQARQRALIERAGGASFVVHSVAEARAALEYVSMYTGGLDDETEANGDGKGVDQSPHAAV